MVITSISNAKVAEIKKLADKKYRKSVGKYVIEGVRLVCDALKFGADVQTVFVKESSADKFDFAEKTVIADNVFDKISETVHSQGVIAVVNKKKDEALSSPCGNCLILDGLQDPGNVGTLIRTAVACGFTDVYAVDSADLYSPKVLRSAMSAHFCIKLHECSDMARVLETLNGVTAIAADMKGDNVFETEFFGRNALIVGNEGRGISEYVRQNVCKTVSLPMEHGFESLNASVAGSVIMYRIYTSTTVNNK